MANKEKEGLLNWLEKQAKSFPNYRVINTKPTKPKLSRVEIIEHGFGAGGRAYVYGPGSDEIELSYQDDNRTLKIFITKKK
jgi:hypothetical protein